jgi:hypothetical protein
MPGSRRRSYTAGMKHPTKSALPGRVFGALLLAGWSVLSTACPAAAGDGSFQAFANPGGGTILSGTVGNDTPAGATAAVLRKVHAELGARPNVLQVARNDRQHAVALLFTVDTSAKKYTGIAIVQASPGAQTAAVAIYDTSARFRTTLGPMMRRLGSMTESTSASASASQIRFAPAQALTSRSFADGTGSIGLAPGWNLASGGGGSALAVGPGNVAQVSYNMHFGGIDPSNPRAQMFLRTASPLARQNFHGAVLPYTGDAEKAWVAMYEALSRQNGFQPEIHVVQSSASSSSVADFTGTLGSGAKTIRFIVHAFVLPPNPNGMWTLSDSHVFVKESQLGQQAATANAVLSSVRINFGAVAAQQDAIRQSFQRLFDSEIANDRAQDAARQQRTDEALASDRAAQESMHKDAVAMENYSLDRAVVVDTTTGVHSTVDSGFADALVQGDPNYQKVPASELLRGVDY